MCSTWVTPGDNRRGSHSLDPNEVKIVAAADEMQDAAFFERIERHAQSRRQFLDELSVFVDHLRGSNEMACAVGPAILAIPGHAVRVRPDPHVRFDVEFGARRHRRAEQRAQPREHAPEQRSRGRFRMRPRSWPLRWCRRSARAPLRAVGSRLRFRSLHAGHDAHRFQTAFVRVRQWRRECGGLCHMCAVSRR